MGWKDRGNYIKGSRRSEEKFHRFTRERLTISHYENFIREQRSFYDRSTGLEVANIDNAEDILYVNTFLKDNRKFMSALNEAKRLSKATKVSEFCSVIL